MKKHAISKLFLYRHRFTIGYITLALLFLSLLFTFPLFTQNGLSSFEITSATHSHQLNKNTLLANNLVDLPYHLLQKLSITLFGLTIYAIKLPSIIIGVFLGLLFVLLLNRWFKSNVSLLASCLITLSTAFLFLAGSGTPLIMLVFWPTLLLWLGSKIQGEKHPKPLYCIAFAFALLLSLFTPYMLYFAVFCVFFVLLQPHLRFVVTNLPKLPLLFSLLVIILCLLALTANISKNPAVIIELLFAKGLNFAKFKTNIITGFTPVFSWRHSTESVFLSPLIGLPSFALILIGLFSTTKGFFASRNSIASLLLVFTIIITGFNPQAIVAIILPASILIAHGIKYLLEKWYGLFPENPYARISAIPPLALLFGIIIVSGTFQYVNGYHYNPKVANQFFATLTIIHDNLKNETLVVSEDFDFYRILTNYTNLRVVQSATSAQKLAFLGKPASVPQHLKLSRIITSGKSNNSDIIYLYTAKGE